MSARTIDGGYVVTSVGVHWRRMRVFAMAFKCDACIYVTFTVAGTEAVRHAAAGH